MRPTLTQLLKHLEELKSDGVETVRYDILRELMGHSSITITQRSCHPTPEHKLAAVAKLAEYKEAATKKPQSQTEAIQ